MKEKYILKVDKISTYDIKVENMEEMKTSIFRLIKKHTEI